MSYIKASPGPSEGGERVTESILKPPPAPPKEGSVAESIFYLHAKNFVHLDSLLPSFGGAGGGFLPSSLPPKEGSLSQRVYFYLHAENFVLLNSPLPSFGGVGGGFPSSSLTRDYTRNY